MGFLAHQPGRSGDTDAPSIGDGRPSRKEPVLPNEQEKDGGWETTVFDKRFHPPRWKGLTSRSCFAFEEQ